MPSIVDILFLMNVLSLTITPEAEALIRKALDNTRIEKPAVYLIEISEEIKASDPLRVAIENVPDSAKSRETAQAEIQERLLAGRWRLVPAVYPKGQFPKAYLMTVNGMPFVVPPNLEQKLKDGTLDVAERGLVLRDANGVVLMPR